MTRSILDSSITAHIAHTPRLRIHYLNKGPQDGIPVIFVHGNLSSSLLWDETLAALPNGYRAFAIDMRGFGDTESRPLDATRGMGDFADDLRGFVETLGLNQPAHLVGHSTGGGVIMHYALNHPTAVASLTLAASVSPYGFGGTIVNQKSFVRREGQERIGEKQRSDCLKREALPRTGSKHKRADPTNWFSPLSRQLTSGLSKRSHTSQPTIKRT